MATNVEGELELGDYLAILKRRWVWAVAPLIVFPTIAFLLTTSQSERYSASADVLLSDSAAQDAVGGGSQSTAFRNRTLENEIRLARSDQATNIMAERFGVEIDNVPAFDVAADAGSDVLIFSASSSTADRAAAVANAAAETYVTLKREQAAASITDAVDNLENKLIELQEEREAVRATLTTLEDALARADEEQRPAAQAQVDREEGRISSQLTLIEAQITATAGSITQLELSGELALGGTARIVSLANPPLRSTNAPPARNMVLGLMAGAVVGAALALLRENLDNKIRSTEDFERLGLIPLGAIPNAPREIRKSSELALISLSAPDAAQSQAHQKTQAAVRFLASQQDISNVLITSASQGEGKTTLASNLAISMALTNVRTVLVDLDLRRPRVHKAYGLPQSPGITSVVVDDVSVVESATLVPQTDDHLAVVPSGKLPPHAGAFINSDGFGEAVKMLAKLSDFTVFDAPPILPVADTLSLAQMVDGVIIVAYANQTKRADLEAALASLKHSGASVLGGVLLGAAIEHSSYEYYSAADDLERM